MTSHLLRSILDLLDQHNTDGLRKIAEDANVDFAWLRKVAIGEIKNPGVMRLELLHLHLTGTRFPVEH